MDDKQQNSTITHLKWRDIERDAPKASAEPLASKRLAAGILGILFGCLGIHKFVLGYRGPGLIMLLVSVLSLGLAAPVMAIIGLVEGIVYLTKSDSDFVANYQTARRDWF
jgi:TM2 domain-containing membrane protein YozV